MPNSRSIWTKDYLLMCLSSFLMFMNFYMLAVTMPIFVQTELQGNKQQMSLVIALYIFGTVLTRPFSGLWADKYGKKKIATIFSLLFFICTTLFLGIHAIVPLLIVRFVQGLIYAIAGTGSAALVIDLIPADKKGEGIGYYSMFMSLAMIFGPALGLFLLEHYSYDLLLMVCGGFAGLAFLIILITKQKDPQLTTSVISSNNKTKKTLQLADFITVKAIPICLVGLIFAFAYCSLMNFIPLYAKELGVPETASLFFIASAITVILPRPLVGKIFDKYGANYLIYSGLICFMIGAVILATATGSTQLLIAGLICGLGYGAVFPAFQTLAVKLSPSNKSGAGTATFFVFFDIGYGGGSFVLSLIATHIGYAGVFLFAGGIIILAIAVYYLGYHRINNNKHSTHTQAINTTVDEEKTIHNTQQLELN